MSIRLISILVAALTLSSAYAAHETRRLAPAEYGEHGFTVQSAKYNPDDSLVWIYLSGPLKKWDDVALASIGFLIEQDGKILVESDCPIQEVEKGRATARFLLRKGFRGQTTIKIVYGLKGGGTFLLSIPEEKEANKGAGANSAPPSGGAS